MAFSDEDTHRYIDGRLEPGRARMLEAAMAGDPVLKATVDAFAAQRRALSELGRDVLEERLPPAMQALIEARRRPPPRIQVRRRRGIAAVSIGIAIAFGAAGFVAGRVTLTETARGDVPLTGTAGVVVPAGAPRFVRDGIVAHAVYSPEVRHPVEVGATDRDHLVQWLTRRMGTQVAAPPLAEHGFELVGGRLLPGEAGPSAQFMYQDGSGQRVTLYVSRTWPDDATMSAFRFERAGRLQAFYWIDRSVGYVLSGDIDRERLARIARTVHRSLGS